MIYLGSDHAGFMVKEKIKEHLTNKGIECTDLGTDSEESVDYPDFGFKVARAVVSTNAQGILVCGSGIGICIAANKIQGARAAHCISTNYAKLARMHNNANILCLAGREPMIDSVEAIVDTFLTTEFESSHERHVRRVLKITENVS